MDNAKSEAEAPDTPAIPSSASPRSSSAGSSDASTSALGAAGKVALSAMLATSLAGVLNQPPRKDLMTLPDPVPIVRVLEQPQVAPAVDVDEDEDKARERLKRILKILKFLLAALALCAAVTFALLKGCSSCSTGMPIDSEESSASELRDDISRPTADAAHVYHVGVTELYKLF